MMVLSFKGTVWVLHEMNYKSEICRLNVLCLFYLEIIFLSSTCFLSSQEFRF